MTVKAKKLRIMTGGICPCGGKLKHTEWETAKMIKEVVRCKVCGRLDRSIRMKSEEIVPW
jgi:hypothetical protein